MPQRLQLIAAIVVTLTAAPAALAQAPATAFDIVIAPQDLEGALLAVSRATGREIVFASDVVAGRRALRLAGRFTPEDAVRRLLRGSGLQVRVRAGAIVIVAPKASASGDASGDVVVTGSRIRGAQAYAPVTTVSRAALQAAGQTNLGDAVRTIPQNFGGGQSPFIGLGAEDYGSDNLTSGSSINLRGLGPDATLTLLNGRRLAYDGVFEGVDVSAIPLAAIDRIEVVTDGASAIYGSDAVAGVANVVLRRDYSGLETSARLGAATDGGDLQQQYQTVGGTTWASGGAVATLSYDHASAVTADQRSFSRQLDRTTTIVPRTQQLSAVVSAHEEVARGVEADLDLLWSRRKSYATYPNSTPGTYLDSGVERAPRSTSFGVSPSVKIGIGEDWTATINATYARDEVQGGTRFYLAGAVIADYRVAYSNQSASGEASAEGVLASLPGGEARLALGLGYRWVGLASERSGGGTESQSFKGSRDSYYGFGELNLPLVGTTNQRPGVARLSANLASRFEHYPQIGNVFTPKIGLLYAPTTFLEFRGTWGRSFKAPTLEQLYGPQNALLFTADVFGGAGDPPTATTLYLYGGNAGLAPQRATNWSAGFVLSPFDDRRLTFEATWFSTRYTDRIVAPITSPYTALADSRVASLISFNPSVAEVSAVLARLGDAVANYSGYPLDPASVVAIIDNRYSNVSVERAEGVDVTLAGRLPLSSTTSLALSAAGTYLTSDRRVSPGQDAIQLAGTIFSPAHFRARSGASLSAGPFSSAIYATVTGGVVDNRFTPQQQVDGQTSIDLSLGYAFPQGSGFLHGASAQLAVLNLFDDLPDRIRTAVTYYTPFDTTNYNPVGRLVSLTVTKRW
jgi:iron complex outermembrane recepter protein